MPNRAPLCRRPGCAAGQRPWTRWLAKAPPNSTSGLTRPRRMTVGIFRGGPSSLAHPLYIHTLRSPRPPMAPAGYTSGRPQRLGGGLEQLTQSCRGYAGGTYPPSTRSGVEARRVAAWAPATDATVCARGVGYARAIHQRYMPERVGCWRCCSPAEPVHQFCCHCPDVWSVSRAREKMTCVCCDGWAWRWRAAM